MALCSVLTHNGAIRFLNMDLGLQWGCYINGFDK